jgi:aconitate hydratase
VALKLRLSYSEKLFLVLQEVFGFKHIENLSLCATATKLVLSFTKMKKMKTIVRKYVEFFQDRVKALSILDRTTRRNVI